MKQLFELVRAALWQRPVDLSYFQDESLDWDEIGKISKQQTVAALVYSSVLTLPIEYRPPKEWIYKAYAFLERNRFTHSLLDKTVAEVTSKLKKSGISTVLLKGQAYAHVYPRPELRQCGDIDLYVGEDKFHEAYSAAKAIGCDCMEPFVSDAKHYGCFLNNVRIELHRIAGVLPSRSASSRFNSWSRQQLNSGHLINIDGVAVTVPPPMFDVVFVFLHLYNHFISGGIGLRHVCDWVMLLHRHCNKIDREELEKLLREFNLTRGWRFFTPIAVTYLGLPESECPLYSPEYKREAEKILAFMMKEGNFGKARRKSADVPKTYLARKLYSLRLYTGRISCKLWVDPKMVAIQYGKYVRQGIKRVIEDFIR